MVNASLLESSLRIEARSIQFGREQFKPGRESAETHPQVPVDKL